MRMASIHYWIILLLSFRVGNCFLSSHTRRQGISPSALYVKENPPRRLLIFGNGNVANEVVNHLNGDNCTAFETIYCTYRKTPPATKSGVKFIHFDYASDVVSDCSHMLITIPPLITEDLPGENYRDPVTDNLDIMHAIPKKMTIGYVSTTGVYGNHNNSWVDETSPILCKPGAKAFAYYDIEKRWQRINYDTNRKVFIFRCAGLYGDKFSALHSVLKSGIPKPSSVDPNDEGYTSRVHLKDVARAIIAAMKDTGLNGGICNLSDSLPAPRSLVMKHAGELMLNHNVTVTGSKSEDSGTSERNSRRNKDRKRVSNEKMKAILKDEGGLLFPSYFEGLREVLSINIDQWKTID